MHILVISIFYPPERGAAPSRIDRMCQILRKANNTVEVLTTLPNYPTGNVYPEYTGKGQMIETIDGIRIHRYPTYNSNSSNPAKRGFAMLSFSYVILKFSKTAKQLDRFDLVIVQSPPLLAGYAGVRLAKRIYCKSLLNVSDLWPQSAVDLGALKKGFLYKVLRRVERSMYRAATAVMGQSEDILNAIRIDAPEKESFLYRNLDKPSIFYNSGRDPSKPLKIVYAGLLGIAQDVLGICKAIDFSTHSASLDIYGAGNQLDEITSYIASNPDSGISYKGSVAKSEMPEIMAEYEASLIPLATHISGAFPSKVYAAIEAGLPILFVGEAEGARFVQDHRVGYVSKPGNMNALSENIAELASLPVADYMRMIDIMKDLKKTLLNFNKQADALVDFAARV